MNRLTRRALSQVAAEPIVMPRQAFVSPLEALRLCRQGKERRFDESLELIVNLKLDTRKQDQTLRLTADLPSGTGKVVRMAAFTLQEEQAEQARLAGCELVGGLELIDQILQTKQVDFEKSVATPEMMPHLAKVGKILGPRGVMPNKKLGNVVENVADVVQKLKAGSVEMRADRGGKIHCLFGKRSMDEAALMKNLKSLVLCMENNKPSGVKVKRWVLSAYIKSSMGLCYSLDLQYLDPKSPRFMAME